MSKFVRIQSNETIHVTCGLQNKDVTNADAHVPDRLKVSATWPKATVLIQKGAHMYPSEIVEWATVKALAKAKYSQLVSSQMFVMKRESNRKRLNSKQHWRRSNRKVLLTREDVKQR